MRNPQRTQLCETPSDAPDSTSLPVDDDDGGGDSTVFGTSPPFVYSDKTPSFPEDWEEHIEDAKKLVAKDDTLSGDSGSNISDIIPDSGGIVCHYKPIKF